MEKFNIDESNKNHIFNDTGVESIIFYYDDERLLKYFRDKEIKEKQIQKDLRDPFLDYPRKVKDFPKESLPNKEKKIKLLDQKKNIEDEVKILGPAYQDGKFKGYIMNKEDLKKLDMLPEHFSDRFILRKRKIALLKLIREKIEKLNAEGIFIGDFNQNNFLTDKNVSLVKLCDLDNLKIDGLDFDTKHRFVQYYESSDANINNIDSYCFNLFTIAYLNNYDLGYFDYRGPLKLPKELKTKENMDICESMTHLDSSYVPKYLIDNMR